MALETFVDSLSILVAMGSVDPHFCTNDLNLLTSNPQVHHFLIPFQFSYPKGSA